MSTLNLQPRPARVNIDIQEGSNGVQVNIILDGGRNPNIGGVYFMPPPFHSRDEAITWARDRMGEYRARLMTTIDDIKQFIMLIDAKRAELGGEGPKEDKHV
jgi:hypothetical protein